MELATRYLERRMVRRPRAHHRRPLPARPGRRQQPRHGGLLARARRLGAGHRPVAGHARRRVPRGADRARAARDRRSPAADPARRPVRDARRRARGAGAGAAARPVDGLPGHLPHDVGPLRRAGRAGHRARRSRPPSTCPSRRGWPLPEVAGPVAVLALGLVSAASWGAGDFGGGLLSRRAPLFGVVFGMQLIGMLAALAIGVARGEPIPQGADVAWAVAAGGFGVVGITSLYRGLAVGRMGVVAPTTGVLAAVVPGRRWGSRSRASRRPRSSWASGSRCSPSCW